VTRAKWLITIFFGLLVLGAVTEGQRNNHAEPDAAPRNAFKDGWAVESIKFTWNSWHKGGFGNVALLSFTIENTNAYAVKDVEIYCDWRAASGTTLGSHSGRVYQTILPHKKLKVSNFNFGFIDSQVATASCRPNSFMTAE